MTPSVSQISAIVNFTLFQKFLAPPAAVGSFTGASSFSINLHDGRTDDLEVAISAHQSSGNTKFGPSEANTVIDSYNRLSDGDQQDLLNFLRSL